jgi:drug/metabolite transporter (DMT)-like permease
LINGELMALAGSFSLSIYFIISSQMKLPNSMPFNTFNISLFGVVVFAFLSLFFDGYMQGDDNDSVFTIFEPWYKPHYPGCYSRWPS